MPSWAMVKRRKISIFLEARRFIEHKEKTIIPFLQILTDPTSTHNKRTNKSKSNNKTTNIATTCKDCSTLTSNTCFSIVQIDTNSSINQNEFKIYIIFHLICISEYEYFLLTKTKFMISPITRGVNIIYQYI